jgi:hypothetical protein
MKHEMIDNRMVHSTRQRGIERVLQKKGDSTRADHEGHQGKMNDKRGNESNWKRSGGSLTPRKA